MTAQHEQPDAKERIKAIVEQDIAGLIHASDNPSADAFRTVIGGELEQQRQQVNFLISRWLKQGNTPDGILKNVQDLALDAPTKQLFEEEIAKRVVSLEEDAA